MYACKILGSAVYGSSAITITIEVNISQGVNFFLVGLPDSAVKESQQQIDAALKNNGYKIPGKKIVINMAPRPIALNAKQASFKGIIIPKQNAKEAAVVTDMDILGAENIKEMIDFLMMMNILYLYRLIITGLLRSKPVILIIAYLEAVGFNVLTIE